MQERTYSIYQAIRTYMNGHNGIPPSIRELSEICAINSTSMVKHHLNLLKQSGHITFVEKQARSIRLTRNLLPIGSAEPPPECSVPGCHELVWSGPPHMRMNLEMCESHQRAAWNEQKGKFASGGVYSAGVITDPNFYRVPTVKAPTIVCLCGSTSKAKEAFQKANLEETLAGRIVLTIGCDMKSDAELFADKSEAERHLIKRSLDLLHLRKIDLADEILVLNVGGYIGESTSREIAYARQQGKRIRWLEAQSHESV